MTATPDLNHRFAFHPADVDARQIAHEDVRRHCRNLAIDLDRILPDGREKALAITNLEQVMFWANAAIARQEPTA